MTIRLFFLWIVISFGQAWAGGLAFTNTVAGYQLEIPQGWVQVPDAVVTERKKLLPPEGQRLTFDAVFQPGQSGGWMTYPYITVQIVGRVAPNRLMTEQEFVALINRLRGVKAMPEMQSTLANMTRQSDADIMRIFLDSAMESGITIDTARRKYWFSAENPYVGKKGMSLTGGSVLSNGMLIQLNGAYEKKDIQWFIPTFMKIFNSVRDI